MAQTKADQPSQQQAQAAAESKESLLMSIFERVEVAVPQPGVDIQEFKDPMSIAEKPKGAMVAAALRVFVDAVAQLEKPVERIDKNLLDGMIASLDMKLSGQLDEILHNGKFQQLESGWRGLKFVVDRTDFRKNVRIEMIDISKDALRASFEDAPELIQSGLYKHVYTGAYDQPGADPYGAMVSNYEFDNSAQDIALMQEIAKVSSASHCPFIGAVGPKFFGKKSMEDWKRIPDFNAWMETADYIKWRTFRESEDSRYIGLTFPRFLLRLPYGPDSAPVKSFNYVENVKGPDHEKYLWGNSGMAFATNLIQAYITDGWCVQIRGPQAGGTVQNLPVHVYDVGKGKQVKIPTEVPIDETLEFTCANLGFIPFSHYQGRDYACFFSANSTQKPAIYEQPEATANSRINARLPYIFLASRIAHYLKVLQRENIGTTKDRVKIEHELNGWIRGLVTEMKNPTEEQIAKHPLRAAQVRVYDIEENPGFYRVEMMIMPHFQIEGMDISLSLVGKMPKAK
jgi:type VI secretion system protein ImpC